MIEPPTEPSEVAWGSQPVRESYTTEQARMRLREQLTISGPPENGTDEEYFIRACFPAPEER